VSRKLRKLKKEYRESTSKEIREAIIENTVYGFLGSTLIVFISSGVDIAVLMSYLVYYFFLGRVVNRPKYVTSLGKFILFPVPTALGAFVGYKFAGYISEMFL
jgi:predicted tellurium resistance membrane protein TerC